jgi:hypothetical protein
LGIEVLCSWEGLSSRDIRFSRLESRSHAQLYKGCRLGALAGNRQVKKMYSKKRIAALTAIIFIPGAVMAIGMPADSVVLGNLFSVNLVSDAEKKALIVLAQNDKGAPEENEKAESESNTNESDGAAGDDKESSDSEPGPLTPFVPSEQIAGGQAVDFPADI